jgi:hypothetical protein
MADRDKGCLSVHSIVLHEATVAICLLESRNGMNVRIIHSWAWAGFGTCSLVLGITGRCGATTHGLVRHRQPPIILFQPDTTRHDTPPHHICPSVRPSALQPYCTYSLCCWTIPAPRAATDLPSSRTTAPHATHLDLYRHVSQRVSRPGTPREAHGHHANVALLVNA